MKTTEFKKMVAGIIALVSLTATAQEEIKPSINTYEYKNALGLRAGETSGLTYKHFFKNNNAFEGIFSFWPYSFGFTGLYEKHTNIGVPGLNLYYGLGGHINAGGARYRAYYIYNDKQYVYVRRTDEVAVGFDGIIGIEYKFKPVPIAVSADLKPYVETSNYGYTYFTLDPSVGVKFTF